MSRTVHPDEMWKHYDHGSFLEFDFQEEYIEKCDNCDKEYKVRTQKDVNPEYYTNVYVKCDCGDYWVEFELPVN